VTRNEPRAGEGAFANVRIKTWMVPGLKGGVGEALSGGEQTSIFDGEMRYQKEKVPLVILAGHGYVELVSSRDWAAKGKQTSGVERRSWRRVSRRIHRSNLVGLWGVLAMQFLGRA